ncbi:MAG: HAD hydrolase family protein, partial [Sphingomonadales bacterium]|jgi:phosphoserine phosphatase
MHRSNELGVLSGKLTGTVVPPISNATTKLETLQRLATEKSLSADEIIAVGDGANDIPMMEAAGLSVAYHAKPKAQVAATTAINNGDLTALLYLQGIKKADFVTK